MIEKTYTLLCPFGGLGAGALGFLQAETRLFETRAKFKLLGGIDVDAGACADFEYLTGVPEWCADVWDITPAELRARFGARGPDVVFLSPPCKGSSGLLSEAQARKAKYRKLNKLALKWIQLMLEAWADSPPRLILFENVPRIVSRAKRMLAAVRAHLRRAGYVMHDGVHDAGELGGLAQHRRRYLLVARHQKSVESLLYQPVKKRVRACGEVLGALPIPNDPAGGPLHRLPNIGWLNWVRLALIPAGGDWRDLPGVLEDGQERREVFKRHAVEDWDEPTGTVGGSGSNGVENVADPRPGECFRGTYGVSKWDDPAATVTGSAAPSTGRFAVADPRIKQAGLVGIVDRDDARRTVRDPRLTCKPRAGAYGVTGWDESAKAVTGATSIDAAEIAVADPRLIPQRGNANMHEDKYEVRAWAEPAGTVTGAKGIGSGAPSVADPRLTRPKATNGGHDDVDDVSRAAARKAWEQHGVKTPGERHWFKGKYGVQGWDEPSRSVIGGPSNGANAVADPRAKEWFGNVLRIVGWGEPTGTVTNSPSPSSRAIAVADPRVKGAFDHGYRVTPWEAPSPTVAAGSHPGQGAYSVADPRVDKAALVGIVTLSDARATVTGRIACPFALVDPSSDGPPIMVVRDVAKAPPAAPVILAEDGTWHRPLTTLELAVLQGLPALHHGAPLQLSGTGASAHRERIGNAVPVQAATAIAEQMLITLLSSDLKAFSLSSAGGAWVTPTEAAVVQ